jgi:hypothetical protein
LKENLLRAGQPEDKKSKTAEDQQVTQYLRHATFGGAAAILPTGNNGVPANAGDNHSG